MHWFLSIIIGPVLGYFFTDVDGWADPQNWRTVLWIRVLACWVWPVGAAIVFMITAHLVGDHRPGMGTILGHLVVSSVCIYPAINAIRDLASGPRAESVRVIDKRVETSATRSSVFEQYFVVLEDGHEYGVDREVYASAHEGERSVATRLLNTDMLLDLRR